MPKVKVEEPSVVDIENRKRMEEGMLILIGRDMRGNDAEYNGFLRLAKLAEADPTVNTFQEVHDAIHGTFRYRQDRMRLLGGNRPA